jgi:hypothetical protein
VDALINLKFLNMKNIKKLLLLVVVLAGVYSCTTDADATLTSDNNAGGLLEKVVTSVSYVQGSPAATTFNGGFSAFQGREKIQSVSVYKQYFGTVGGASKVSNKVLLKTVGFPNLSQYESASFGFTFAELGSGLTYNSLPFPVSDSGLGIGDYWELTYVANLNNGKSHLGARKTKVTVSCGSFLARNYSNVTFTYGAPVFQYNHALDVVTKTGDGEYNNNFVGRFHGSNSPAGTRIPAGASQLLGGVTDAGITFTDVCGRIGVATQNLGGIYPNEIRQSAVQKSMSNVNSSTGVITIVYSVGFSSNTVLQETKVTLTPIP